MGKDKAFKKKAFKINKKICKKRIPGQERLLLKWIPKAKVFF